MAELIEIEFKGERRAVYENTSNLTISINEYVIVEAERGVDMGIVVQKGDILKRKKGRGMHRKVIRKAAADDIEKLHELRTQETEAFKTCQNRIHERELEMRLVDVEYQFDCNRITFYFTADQRVDFRELVKDLAVSFKTRIEMRQIGARDQAKRIGGYGTCGRKLCCTTFLTEFVPVTLKMAKDQSLSLNPLKISGVCGRLMCCLMYEEEFYKEHLKKFPIIGSKILTDEGEATVSIIDIFKENLVITYRDGREKKISLKEYYEMKEKLSQPKEKDNTKK